MSTMCIDVLIDATVDDFLTIASAGSICDQRNVWPMNVFKDEQFPASFCLFLSSQQLTQKYLNFSHGWIWTQSFDVGIDHSANCAPVFSEFSYCWIY